jgi:hypothetical protein
VLADTPSVERIATPLRISGLITIAVSVALGVLVTPIVFLGVLVGIVDLVLAMAFARGWIGRSDPGSDAAVQADTDPAYNPYARED